MTDRVLPSPDEMRQLLRYDPSTGKLWWLPRKVEWFRQNERLESERGAYPAERLWQRWTARHEGKEAFTTNSRGYMIGSIRGRHIPAQRAAFAIVEGRWPEIVDHIDGNPSNNAWSNLREVTHAENMLNMKKHVTNTSGVAGVSLSKATAKWEAYIWQGNKKIGLGYYADKADAIRARQDAEKRLGYHANHGKR